MRAPIAASLTWFAVAFAAHGQRLSIGVVGGANVTANFPATDVSGPADAFGNPAYRFQYLTGPRSFIAGALVEGRLTQSVSIEANVLHRPLKTTIIFTEFHPDGATVVSTDRFTAVRAWQFPVMLKYTLPSSRFTGRIRPFLAAGLSFRTQEDASATEPSQFGWSAGAGAAVHLGRFRLAPTLRYTRWQRESVAPRYSTKPDQVELLTSLAYETGPDSRRLAGRKLEVGAVAGLPLTPGFRVIGGIDERTRYLAGLSLQAMATKDLLVEVNAIYKPLRGVDFSVLTWQFPVLAKYRWTRSGWSPFVAAGPSFRLAGNLNSYDPSHVGATVGAGMETHTGGVRLSPALRYTRWAKDTPAFARTNPDSVEIIFGVSF